MSDSKKIKKGIEAILLIQGEPISFKKLAQILNSSVFEIAEGVSLLKKDYENRGINLMEDEEKVQFVTASSEAKILEEYLLKDLKGKLSRAALETLTIIAYRAPISRPRIEAIRGVNCTFSLRSLLIRNLIERFPDPQNLRTFLYKPSLNLLKFLGVNKKEDLPQYAELSKNPTLETLEKTAQNIEN
jgi:segregation and condensation protein B